MPQAILTQPTSSSPSLASGPKFLIESQRWHKIFFRNLNDLLWPERQPSLHLSSSPGEFWPDVFVSGPLLPWRRIPVSAVLHISVVALILAVTHFWPEPVQVVAQERFNSNDVISFSPSEYLPPIDTGGEHASPAKHGEPAYARQPIISVPREATNHTQTIVTPPDVKLKQDAPMPNVVAWKQAAPAVPIAATENLQSRKAPMLPSTIVAPAPTLTELASQRVTLLQQKVVAPQPELQMNLSRRVDEINIGHQQVVAPAPQLQIAESHTSPSIAGLGEMKVAAPQPTINLAEHQKRVALPESAAVAPAPNIQISPARRVGSALAREQVVAPAPNVSRLDEHSPNHIALGRTNEAVPPVPLEQSLASKNSDRKIIALNLHPSVEVAQPQGNRRGTFAATPEGKKNAAGTPDATPSRKANASNNNTNALPAGLHVGAPENSKQKETGGNSNKQGSGTDSSDANDHPLMASVTVPRVSSSGHPAREVPASSATDEDRRVFGGHKFYSMAMNFADFNSAGGSWIFHFAEQKDSSEKGDLMAPEVEHQVDPAYPTDLMQHNVHGTVVLFAVVGSDGSVSGVKVLESVDDRLDEYAREALSKWHFRPATRNGNPVALTMVVKVPFRPSRNAF